MNAIMQTGAGGILIPIKHFIFREPAMLHSRSGAPQRQFAF
jgi:hypothetical protein